jgi:hypothetical protein
VRASARHSLGRDAPKWFWPVQTLDFVPPARAQFGRFDERKNDEAQRKTCYLFAIIVAQCSKEASQIERWCDSVVAGLSGSCLERALNLGRCVAGTAPGRNCESEYRTDASLKAVSRIINRAALDPAK